MAQSAPASRRPIAAADTSTTAIVSTADTGPLHEPVQVEDKASFEAVFGPVSASPLGRAVADHLANGGVRILAVRAERARAALEALCQGGPFPLLVLDPELLRPGDLSEADAVCEERRSFLVADAHPSGYVPPELIEVRARNAAVYHPRILDAAGASRPAAAAVTGVFARNDQTRGVWRASAGTSAQVVGAAGVETALSDKQLAVLSGRQVNALRRMPDGSVVVWGDRTVSTEPEWKYVNVRRHLLCLEHSVEDGLQWVVSEVNGEPLWEEVRRDVTTFLLDRWRHGAFPGDSPREAFSVHCDSSTMTEEDVVSGRLVVLVGVATVRPGELVTVRVALTARPGPAVPPADRPVRSDPTAAGPAGESRPG